MVDSVAPFSRGRLDTIGGADFSEANYFAAFMASMLWLIGVQFIRSGWKGRILYFLAGGFTANAIVLARSRGAVVGLAAGGLAACLMAPRKFRAYIFVGLALAGLGFLRLSDQQFLARLTTIWAESEQRDESAQSRIVIWKAGVQICLDHPLGIGAGNFYQTIGSYVPAYAGMDAHNTYVRCLAELGIQGLLVLLSIVALAFWQLHGVRLRVSALSTSAASDVSLVAFGMACSLATLLGCCLTMSLTYVEFTWWLLMLPTCLARVVANEIADNDRVDETLSLPLETLAQVAVAD